MFMQDQVVSAPKKLIMKMRRSITCVEHQKSTQHDYMTIAEYGRTFAKNSSQHFFAVYLDGLSHHCCANFTPAKKREILQRGFFAIISIQLHRVEILFLGAHIIANDDQQVKS